MSNPIQSHDLYQPGPKDNLEALKVQLEAIQKEIREITASAKALRDALKILNSANSQKVISAATQAEQIASKNRILLLREEAVKTRIATQAKKQDAIAEQQVAAATSRANIVRQREIDLLNKQASASKTHRTSLTGLVGSIRNLAYAYFSLGAAAQVFQNILKQTKALDTLTVAFNTTLGSTQATAQAQEYLLDISERFGANLLGASQAYLKFSAASTQAGVSAEETQKIFTSVTKASSILGLGAERTSYVFLALEQIMSKGRLSTEELRRQLGEHLPGAFGIAAEAMGVTTAKLTDMLKKGEIASTDFLPKFAKQLELAYGIDQVERIDNLAAAQERFNNQLTLLIKDSNLSDSFKGMFNSLGNVIGRVREFVNYIKGVRVESSEFFRTQEGLNKTLHKSTVEFNGLIGALKRLKPESEGRSALITEINEKYGDYLTNLLTEKSSLEDIAAAQKEVNKALQEKALLDAFTKATEPLNKRLAELGESFVNLAVTKAKMDEAMATGNFSILDDHLNAIRDAPTAEARAYFDAISKGIESTTGLKAEDFINLQADQITTELAGIKKLYEDVAKGLNINFADLFKTPEPTKTKGGGDDTDGAKGKDPRLVALQYLSDLNKLKEDSLEKDLEALRIAFEKEKIEHENQVVYLLELDKWYAREKQLLITNDAEASREGYENTVSSILEGFERLRKLRADNLAQGAEELEANRSKGVETLRDEFKARREHEEAIFDLSKHTAEEEADFKLKLQADELNDEIQLHRIFGKVLNEEELARAIELRDKILAEIGKPNTAGEKSEETDIFSLLNINFDSPEQKEALIDALDFAKQQLTDFLDFQKEIIDQEIENADRKVEAAENNLQRQIALQTANQANNVAGAQAELALAKKTQEEALKQRQKFQKTELALNTALEASNLGVAIAKTLAAGLGIAGIGLVALMLGAFAAAKIKAFQLVNKKTFRKGGFEMIGGGSHESGKDTHVGGGNYAEKDESVGIFTAKATRKYKPTLKALVNAANKGTLENILIQDRRAIQGINMVNKTDIDTSLMEKRLTRLVSLNETKTFVDGRGRLVRMDRGRTTVINK